MTPTWITSIRQYLHRHNLTITLTETSMTSDLVIMTAEHLQRYSPSQQRDINLVRLHLQVQTLSDITDPTRPNVILLHMLDGKRKPNTPISPFWPRQLEPSNAQRRLWKRFIASSYLRYIPFWKNPPTLTRRTPNPPTTAIHPTPTTSLLELITKLPKSKRRLLASWLPMRPYGTPLDRDNASTSHPMAG